MLGLWRVRWGGAAALCFVCSALVAPATGASVLDPTFARGGVSVRVQEAIAQGSLAGMLRQRDGSLLLIGSIAELRMGSWTSDGRPRWQRTVSRRPVSTFRPTDVLQLADGTIRAAGAASIDEARPAAVAAITSTGRVVRSYGVGGLSKDFAVPGGEFAGALSIVASAGRRVTIGGYAVVGDTHHNAIARLDDRGRPDPRFGTGGVMMLQPPGTGERLGDEQIYFDTGLNDLAAQRDGKVLAAGTVVRASDGRRVGIVARWDAAGQLDPTFGHGLGYVFLPASRRDTVGRALVLTAKPRPRIVVAAQVGRESDMFVRLFALTPGGDPDSSFGRAGQARPPVYAQGVDDLRAWPDGRLALAGSGAQVFYVAKAKANGAPDGNWGAGGVACVDLPDDRGITPDGTSDAELLPAPRGRLLLAGEINDYDDRAWVLARLKGAYHSPVECFRSLSFSPTSIRLTASLGRRGRLMADVFHTSARGLGGHVGTVDLGLHPAGESHFTWNARVGGRPPAPGNYLLVPRLAARNGRAIGTGHAAFVFIERPRRR